MAVLLAPRCFRKSGRMVAVGNQRHAERPADGVNQAADEIKLLVCQRHIARQWFRDGHGGLSDTIPSV